MMLEAKEYLERTRETLFYSQKRPSDTQDTSTKQAGDGKETKEPVENNKPHMSAEPNSKPSSDEVTTITDAETPTQPPIPALEVSSSESGSSPLEPADGVATPIEPAQTGEDNQINIFLELDTPNTQISIPLVGSSLPGTDDKLLTPAGPIQAVKLGGIPLDPKSKMDSDVLREWKCGRCSKSVQDEETLHRCFGHSCRGMS